MRIVVSKIPNLLTLLRIAAAPVIVMLLRDSNYEAALVLFILAGITDGLDGWIANRFNCATELGARLDPLADKVLIVTACAMLVWLNVLPFWLMTLIIFRDAVILGGYLMLITLDGNVPMRPTLMSKTNTFLQISLIILVLLENTMWFSLPHLSTMLMGAVTVSTVISGAQYVWVWAIKRNYREEIT